MGCTPSKPSMTYTHERVCRDLDTCSTFVPGLNSSVSTPERPSPRLCVETCTDFPQRSGPWYLWVVCKPAFQPGPVDQLLHLHPAVSTAVR
ncbi:hypothetical protein DPEC_G00043410 [Dallia pectoralis]|uniref:Uncharacterized protein n=1 Tax=Dallia pectoralis TaxID=75939 RepID=A0ACC2H9S1_DALPE|nr:hypothetical protein DPEC_G00043410 [Dallia pectoralis]